LEENMSEEAVIVQDTGEVTPVVEVVEPIEVLIPQTPEQPDLRYEYQPTDEHGRSIGGRQVLIYKTPDDLAEKLRDQNVQLLRKLRQVTRNNRLGIDESQIPEDAERVNRLPQVEKKPLTPEERFQLSQDLNDAAKFESARDRLLESAGYNEMIERQKAQDLKLARLEAVSNAQVFLNGHSEFWACTENLQVMTDWMVKNELQPSVSNFERAYSMMQEAGLLLVPPIVREEVPVVAPKPAPENTELNATPVVPVTRISEPVQPQQPSPARVPSGLNSRVASNTGIAPSTATLTLAELERMSSNDYKQRLLSDRTFAEQANKIYAEAEAKKVQRQR
jgi:hypothetical protein